MSAKDAVVKVAQWAFIAMLVMPFAILFPVGLFVVFVLNGWQWSGYLTRLWHIYWGLALFSGGMLSLGTLLEASKTRKATGMGTSKTTTTG